MVTSCIMTTLLGFITTSNKQDGLHPDRSAPFTFFVVLLRMIASYRALPTVPSNFYAVEMHITNE